MHSSTPFTGNGARPRRQRLDVVLCCALLLAVASTVPATRAVAQAETVSVSLASVPEDTARGLRPGDAIRIRVWREPDLTGDFEVDESGVVVLPKLGPVKAGGMAPEALRTQILRTYEAYLVHTSVDVVLLRRVQVIGAVRTPGLYQTDATMTLGDALALAGGITPLGNTKGVQITRDGRALGGAVSMNERLASLPLRSGDQIFVPQRSWISRNPGVVVSLISLAAGITTRVLLTHR
jgi:polysaccharide export outer membrane protein